MTSSTPIDPGPALRDPAHRVSPKAPVLWAAGAAMASAVLLVGLVANELADWVDLPLWVWPVYVVLAIGYTAGMPLVRYQVHRWESTEDAVYTQTGFLSRERRIAPMSRVQTVDYEQSALGRLLGLASVTVTTASAAGPLRIEAIDKAVADRLVADLTRRTEAEAGDAT